MDRAARRRAERAARKAEKPGPRADPGGVVVQSLGEWARSLAPPHCEFGHGPMSLDGEGGSHYGTFCGCEGQEAEFYCATCGDDAESHCCISRLVYRVPDCDLDEEAHE